MLRKSAIALLVATALVVGLITVTVAQRTSTLAALQPLLVDIQQTVPFSLTLTLPDTGMTVTVPSEIDIALSIQIKADGSVSPTLDVTKVEPVVSVTASDSQVDDLGIPYTIEIDSPDLTITEWTTFANTFGGFDLAGEVYLAPDAEPIKDVLAVARFYGSNGRLLTVGEIHNVAYSLRAGGYNRITYMNHLDPAIIDHYTVNLRVFR